MTRNLPVMAPADLFQHPESPVKNAQITANKLRINNAITDRAKCILVMASASSRPPLPKSPGK